MSKNTENPAQALARIANKIQGLEKSTISHVVDIGRLLQEAYQLVEHGAYQDWIRKEFGWSYRSALNYRSAYKLSQRATLLGSGIHQLRLSLSAIYYLAGFLKDEDNLAFIDPILVEAKTRRINRKEALFMFEKAFDKAAAEKAAARAASRAARTESTPAAEPKSETISLLPPELPEPVELDKGEEIAPLPPADNKAVILLRQALTDLEDALDVAERRGLWPEVIKRYGEDDLRRLSSKLHSAINDHCQRTSPVKSAADRAEASSRKVH
jgi:hypothetical protein